MTRDGIHRQGHAVLDLASRNHKAMKIAALLGVSPGGPRMRMLEIGCGSGGISHWFGSSGAMGWDVEAVDVEDVRLVREGFGFRVVDGTQLPFTEEAFDLVVTNHVIEHVGNQGAQLEHLSEIRRVLKRNGIAYLAVPNRWMLVEPHFRLPFLSWLTQGLADSYVRLSGKGTHYDCRPLTCPRLESMLDLTGFSWRQHAGDALKITFELERPDSWLYQHFLRLLPLPVYDALRWIFPTLIYTLYPRAPSSKAHSNARALDSHEGSSP